MKRMTLILTLASLICGCGLAPVYTLHGVEIYASPLAPTKAELSENLDILIEVMAEWSGSHEDDLLNWWKWIPYIEFHDEPMDWTGDKKAAGLYWTGLGVIHLWYDGRCLARTALAHELVHHYSAYWDFPADHSREDLWKYPDGLVAELRRETGRRSCVPREHVQNKKVAE